ncbi:MAG: Crp/Fnr family transcriptional regulator [Pseudaminobacter sp.]
MLQYKDDDHPEQPQRFARLEAQNFDLLFSGCPVERYEPGHHLFMQEDTATHVYGVISGKVEISIYSAGGRKLVANIERPQSLVGEIGALDGGPRTATATCLTDCQLVCASSTQLLDRIGRHPDLARAVIALLCTRLRWVSGEFGDQALLKIEARLAKRLLYLSSFMADAEGWIAISQSDLADFLGATRESVNKTLHDWRARSLIENRRGAVRISNASALAELSELEEG